MSLFDTLIPELQPWAKQLYDVAFVAGVHPRVTSALRTYAQQESAYKTFIQGRSRYPAAKPGTSAHEYGYAFDMVVDGDVNQNDLGLVWKRWNGVWGGDFSYKDPIHFEFPGFNPTVGIVPSARSIPSSTSIRSKAEQLADLLLFLLPTPLARILGTASLATQLLTIFGDDESAITYYLTHPAEAADDLMDFVWGLARAALASYV